MTTTTSARSGTQVSSTLARISEQSSSAAEQARASGTSSSFTGTGGTDQSRLNANFDMWLQLLTTQLKNQSPLDPMKSEQFAQQITQFTGVEQQIKTNSLLEKLTANQASTATNAALGFLGNDVEARGATADLRNGEARWQLNSPAAGTAATITIRNAQGAVVRTETRTLSAGTQTFTWNGRNDAGQAQTDGAYTISIAAKTSNGQDTTVETRSRGRVTAVDFSGSEPVLTVGGARVKLSDVTSVALGSGS